ncbi:MAG TPA: nucleotidyltransferase domain-containing protein [Kofleriaceae bacterium]|nr:nucleotidyltransferase domain-containing protein [Kofleriaceae bacterium]
MTWRRAPYDRAAEEIVAYVKSTYAPVGIVLAGSIVRGEAGPTSDFDVFVVHEEPWRVREQKLFADVPAEIFVNPTAQVRRYFENEHDEGRPCTAHMFATGEVVMSAPVIDELVREARAWLAKPLDVSDATLTQKRYAAVDTLDDARDISATDPAAAQLLLATVVQDVIAYAFWSRKLFQPRRKAAVLALAALDPSAAQLVRDWQQAGDSREALRLVEELATHVLGVNTFFAWTSARDPVAT